VTGAARLPLVPWWCIAGASRDLAVLTVLIPWDGCPLGVLVRRILDRDRRAGLQSRVEKLGHRLPDLLAQSRSVLAEVFDVPLIKKEPRAEGRRAGMNRAPDRLYHAVAVVLCVRVVCTLAENDVAGVPSGIRGSRVENQPGPRVRSARRPYTSPEPCRLSLLSKQQLAMGRPTCWRRPTSCPSRR
jgi:hypothetical protein